MALIVKNPLNSTMMPYTATTLMASLHKPSGAFFDFKPELVWAFYACCFNNVALMKLARFFCYYLSTDYAAARRWL